MIHCKRNRSQHHNHNRWTGAEKYRAKTAKVILIERAHLDNFIASSSTAPFDGRTFIDKDFGQQTVVFLSKWIVYNHAVNLLVHQFDVAFIVETCNVDVSLFMNLKNVVIAKLI